MDPRAQHIADLIRRGRKEEAAQRFSDETGVDAEQARAAVERIAAELGQDPGPQASVAGVQGRVLISLAAALILLLAGLAMAVFFASAG